MTTTAGAACCCWWAGAAGSSATCSGPTSTGTERSSSGSVCAGRTTGSGRVAAPSSCPGQEGPGAGPDGSRRPDGSEPERSAPPIDRPPVLGSGTRVQRHRRTPGAPIEDRPARIPVSPPSGRGLCPARGNGRAKEGSMSEPAVHEAVATIDNGRFGTRTIRFETGRLARQAAGSTVAYLDDESMLLSATTASKAPKEHLDFFPMAVDVEERMYAAGRIPGSFFRREGRPSEDAILTCRLIDRPLRPTFVKGLRNEVQVVITVMSLNPDHLYDVVAINAASASTQISGLPFSGPIGGTRVALIEGQWVAFPNHSQLEQATFDMVVAGRVLDNGEVAIMMVEAEATEHTLALVAGGATRPTEEVVAEGLEAAKVFIAE